MPDAQPAPVGGPLPRGHLLALNRSFRCQAHGHPILAGELRREHIQDFIADQFARWTACDRRSCPSNRST
jgi:hypothetical protein